MSANDSLFETFSIRYDEKVTVTMKVTGEKFSGRIRNQDRELRETPKDLVTLQLDPEYGRGAHHRILASEISVITHSTY